MQETSSIYPPQRHRCCDNNSVSGDETSRTQLIAILHGVWDVDC